MAAAFECLGSRHRHILIPGDCAVHQARNAAPIETEFPPFHRLRQNKSLTEPIAPKMPSVDCTFIFITKNLNQSKCVFIAAARRPGPRVKTQQLVIKKRAEKQPVPFITGREPERPTPAVLMVPTHPPAIRFS